MNQLPLLPSVLPVRRDPPPKSAPRAKLVAPNDVKNLLTAEDILLVAGLRARHVASTISGLRENATESARRIEAAIRAKGGDADEIDREVIRLLHAAVALLRWNAKPTPKKSHNKK